MGIELPSNLLRAVFYFFQRNDDYEFSTFDWIAYKFLVVFIVFFQIILIPNLNF